MEFRDRSPDDATDARWSTHADHVEQ